MTRDTTFDTTFSTPIAAVSANPLGEWQARLRAERERGPFIHTFTGGRFYPLDPRPEEVSLTDIAHALSQVCRYTGHTYDHYSVAQHCVEVSYLLEAEDGDPRLSLLGLLHDAAEAYVVDVSRPVKVALEKLAPGVYSGIEAGVMASIYAAFDLEPPSHMEEHEVKWGDDTALATEVRDLMPPAINPGWRYPDGIQASTTLFHPLPAWHAELTYIRRFRELWSALGRSTHAIPFTHLREQEEAPTA